MTASAPAPRDLVREAAEVVQGWIDRRQRGMLRHLHSCGQTPAQLHVLGLLRETGPATVSQLAHLLGTTPPSASAIVDRMADAGLVERVRGEEDRRVVTVSLAPAGADALQQAVGGRREMLKRVLSQLSEDELRDTMRVVSRLEEAIDHVMSAKRAEIGSPPSEHDAAELPRV